MVKLKLKMFFREVCAFLNTDGGIILIGAPREQKKEINKKNFKRVCIGELTPSKFQNKAWIIQKISANISPLPTNIEIQEIASHRGNFFIIEIPQSSNPPHQCTNEGKYYIRLDEQAKPAPHGIVQALFFNRQKPIITAKIELTKLIERPENEIEIDIIISNESEFPTNNISYLVDIQNIKDVISEDYQDNSKNFKKGKKWNFTLQGMINQVLVKKIIFPIEFFVVHLNQPFLVSILIWGKEFSLYENAFIWDPISFKRILSYKTGDKEILGIKTLLDKFEEIKNNAL